MHVPLFGRTYYRIESAAAAELVPDQGVTLAMAEGFQAPRAHRRFEASARVNTGGVVVTPLAYGGATDADAETAFMREVRAMRRLRLYPVEDADVGAPAAPPSPANDVPRLRVAVVVHLHYRELWPEVAAYMRRIPGCPALIVTVTKRDDELSADIRSAFPVADIRHVENRGYDVAPFLMLLNEGAFDEVDLVCKLPGTKSVRPDGRDSLIGAVWRRASFNSLLSDPSAVLRLFESEPAVGLAGPARLRVVETGFVRYLSMRRNRREMIRLAGLMGVPWYRVPVDFFAGCMFWVRPQALAPFRRLALEPRCFSAPDGKRDGTLAHAAERMFNTAVRQAGFTVENLP